MNINEYALDDDIVAISTALSPAAISVIRTSGGSCFEKVSMIFSRPKKLLSSVGNEVIYGWILENEKKIDEVVLCTYRSPKSFTGENSVEIMCHGGVSITLRILKLLLACGFRQAKAGEFTFRSFVSGKNDLTKVEAIKEIIDAKTPTVAMQASLRLSGILFEKVQEAKNLILKQIAEIDVQIEYPEDEVIEDVSVNTEKIVLAKNILEKVIKNWSMQKLFTDGAKLVLAGKPNSGKSLLFNAILNEDRAIVSEIAGTTRDWLESEINFLGLPIKIYDTAGLRFTNERIEKIGIDNTKLLSEKADIILYLVDCTNDKNFITEEDLSFLANKKYSNIKKILVFTKLDLLLESLQNELKQKAETLLESKLINDFVFISAKNNIGLNNLTQKTYSLLIHFDTKDENVSVGTERQKNIAEKVIYFLDHSFQAAKSKIPLDAIVLDLEEALHLLGELTGEVKGDDILGEIFSGFCVGK